MRSRLAVPLVIGAWLVACNDHGAAKLAKIKDQVCACTTASCAEQAMQQVPAQTIDSNHRTQAIARGMLDCVAKLQDAERPSTDPDAEDKAAGSDEPAPAPAPAAAPATGKPSAAPAAPVIAPPAKAAIAPPAAPAIAPPAKSAK